MMRDSRNKAIDSSRGLLAWSWLVFTYPYGLFVLLYSREFTCLSGYRDTPCVSYCMNHVQLDIKLT